MASFKIHGLVELQKQTAEISELDKGEIAKKMLKEGSKPVAEEWKRQLKQRHVLSGQDAEAVQTSRVKKNRIGRFTITYPVGNEVPYVAIKGNRVIRENRIRRGKQTVMRNAQKAFLQHYGWTNNRTGRFIPGDRFVDIIDLKAQPLAEKTMQTIWDNYLKEKQKGG